MAKATSEEADLFLLASSSPRPTGLPFVVWISPRGSARHDVHLKVSTGPLATPDEMISVAIRPDIRVIEADMPRESFELLRRWIGLNDAVIIQYWNGEIPFTEDALAALRPLGPVA